MTEGLDKVLRIVLQGLALRRVGEHLLEGHVQVESPRSNNFAHYCVRHAEQRLNLLHGRVDFDYGKSRNFER